MPLLGFPRQVPRFQEQAAFVAAQDDFEQIVSIDNAYTIEEDIFSDEGIWQPGPFTIPGDLAITAPLSIYEVLDLVAESFSQPEIITDTDTSEQVVAIDAIELDPDEPGLEIFHTEAVQPVFADQAEITVIDAIELDPDEIGLEIFHTEAVQPVFADQAEISVIDAVELDPDEPGLEIFHTEAVQPVFADQSEITVVDSVDDFEPELGLEYFDQKPVDIADVSEQVVAVDASELEPDEYDAGLFNPEVNLPVFDDQAEISVVDSIELDPDEIGLEIFHTEAVQPVFADQAEISVVDAIELEPDEVGLEVFHTEAVQPVFADQAEVVNLEAIDDFELELGLDYLEQKIVDFTAVADVSEQIVAVDTRELDPDEYDVGLFDAGSGPDQPTVPADVITSPLAIYELIDLVTESFSQPEVLGEQVFVPIESSLMILDGVALVTESFSQPDLIVDAVAAASIPEISVVDSFELEPDEIGLELVQDGAVQPVFSDQSEIVSVASEDDFEPEFVLEYFEQKIVDFTAVADVSEQIVIVDAVELEPDEIGLEVFHTEAVQPVFSDQSEIINLESADDFEPEFGLEYFEQKIVDFTAVADVSEQIVAIDAVELEPDDPGLDLVHTEAVQPVFASAPEVVALAAEDDFEPETGTDLVNDEAVQPVYGSSEIVALAAEELPEETEEERDLYRLVQTLLIETEHPILVGPLDQGEEEEDIRDQSGYFDTYEIETPPPVGDDVTFLKLMIDEGEEEEKASELGVFDFFIPDLPPPPPRGVRSRFNRFAAVVARDNTSKETRDNTSKESRGSSTPARRFNTWRSDL